LGKNPAGHHGCPGQVHNGTRRVNLVTMKGVVRNLRKLHQFSFLKKAQQFLFLPQTIAGQEKDDLSSSYRQALRAQIFPLARSLRSLKPSEFSERNFLFQVNR
jgi:hypothetical protein